ncbi:hypothetical protein [Pseudomonas sp. MWU13-3659]|uniref:hypothetical protein n=1 Tax=Pseudomonas sp. MWU13-3659 TaxID=2986964 RepID=UPI0020759771|nr:hypothetical protein [Pseudomonas sp. MWU13-3659]
MDRKLIPLALLATLIGCSDGQDTTQADLRRAAQAWLDTQYPRCFVITPFPTRTRDFDVEGLNKALHALAQVGVVSEREIARTEVPERLWQPARTDIYYAYDLTEEGRKYYRADAFKRNDGSKVGGLCFGRADITALDDASKPAKVDDRVVSRVSYSYIVSDLPAWASTPVVRAAIVGLDQAASGAQKPLQDSAAMIRTAHGWVHEQLLVN